MQLLQNLCPVGRHPFKPLAWRPIARSSRRLAAASTISLAWYGDSKADVVGLGSMVETAGVWKRGCTSGYEALDVGAGVL